MQYCLWCDEEIILQITWQNLFHVKGKKIVCTKCEHQLEKISGNRCEKCSRPSAETVCYDCIRWNQLYELDDPLTWNYSIYNYNDFMKEVVAQWKYRGDYYLSEIFRESFVQKCKELFSKKMNQMIFVPIPLSSERLFERGFNQAYVLADFMNGNVQDVLTRVHSEKQSKRTRVERLISKNPFQLEDAINKPVVLVDDIYTTGRTIRHAATLLKREGCPEIYSMTLIRG